MAIASAYRNRPFPSYNNNNADPRAVPGPGPGVNGGISRIPSSLRPRPRSVSMADYAPLDLDREALSSAYLAAVGNASSTTNTSTIPSFTSGSTPETWSAVSTATESTPGQAQAQYVQAQPPKRASRPSSTLSHHLRPGDNPHASDMEPDINAAGVGAGHSLSPPGSPFHKTPGSPQSPRVINNGMASPLPPKGYEPETVMKEGVPRPAMQIVQRDPMTGEWRERRPSFMRRGLSVSDIQDLGQYNQQRSQQQSQDSAGQWTSYTTTATGTTGTTARRDLPDPPSNVPPPELPPWEPDYKPQIPNSLTAPSAQNAYAQLSAPPPNLPPRRNHANGHSNTNGRDGTYRNNMSTGPSNQSGPSAGPSHLRNMPPPPPPQMQPQPSFNSSAGPGSGPGVAPGPGPSQPDIMPVSLPTGAPDLPPVQTGEPDAMSPSSPSASSIAKRNKHRPPAEKDIFLRATDRTPIWSTHYIDPSLRNQTSIKVPKQVTNLTNVALSGLAGGPKTRYNQTIGAPIDGLAKLAKEWIIAPDGRFVTQDGGIEVGIGIIDGGGSEWGRDKGRQKARIELESKHGGIKVDVLEIDENRQIDLKVETKTGDILVLLPETFIGVIHITSPSGDPHFLHNLVPCLAPISKPYGDFYSTFVAPLSLTRKDPKRATSQELKIMSTIQRYTPSSARDESDILDQVVTAYRHHTRGEQNKVNLSTGKGRVVLGYRETDDEDEVKGLRLAVGAQEGGKKKKWWQKQD